MKSLEEVLAQTSVFLNDWENGDKDRVMSDFDVRMESAKGVRILFATYAYENYSGDAWVLFEKDGTLFEANGSHCSCFGLEGQWNPDDTTLESIRHRVLNGRLGDDGYSGNQFKSRLVEFLGIN